MEILKFSVENFYDSIWQVELAIGKLTIPPLTRTAAKWLQCKTIALVCGQIFKSLITGMRFQIVVQKTTQIGSLCNIRRS